MTEIQFLLDIVLHCKNLKQVKDKCLARIGEVEAMLVKPPSTMPRPLLQSAHAAIPEAIAQTPAAAAALESRNLAIQQATSGKPEAGRTSPRKF